MLGNALYENNEIQENRVEDKECFWHRKEIPFLEEVRNQLDQLGVKFSNLEGVEERIQYCIPENIERLYKEFPEIDGYIASIKSGSLREGVLACSGPCITENGYEGAEIVVNKDFFGKRNCELKIVEMDTETNWRGERWLAGKGAEGVINHEIGHVMALKLNADKVGLEIGESNPQKYHEMSELYKKNAEITSICYESLKEAGISPRDIGRELSTYGTTDFGETFAEAISEVMTRKHPRIYAKTIVENYRRLVSENEEVA